MRPARVWTGLLASLVLACGGGVPQSGSLEIGPRVSTPKRLKSLSDAPRPLIATRFATETDVYGPYVERKDAGALLVWAASTNGGRTWSTLALSDRGEAQGTPAQLAAAPTEIGLVVLRALATPDPQEASFLLLDTAPEGDGERVEAWGLAADGTRRFGPTKLAAAAARFLWLGGVPTTEGSLVFWVQKQRDKNRLEPAEIVVAALDSKGELRTKPEVVSRDACAWQALKSKGGAALGIVRAHKQRCEAGPVELLRLNGLGKLLGPATVVSSEPSAELDLDAVAVADRSVLVWSDRRGLENRAYAAAVDDAGRLLVPPGPAVPARGEQAVLSLVPPHETGGSAYLVWEDLAERPASGRAFEISPISGEARAAPRRARFEYAALDGRIPEIQATSRGVAALTLAPACPKSPPCNAENRPTFVEFDGELRVTASEPLRIDALQGKSVDFGWGLSCGKSGCFALSALASTPTPLFVTALEARSSYFRPAAAAVPTPPPPRIVESEAVAAAEPLAQIAVAELDGARLVGWITDFDSTTPWQKLKAPATDGRLEPLRARIGLRPFARAQGAAPLGPVQDLSLRAHSLGGIALSASEPAKGEVLAGWAGLDNGVPQVFLTLLGKQGGRVAQRMLTRKPGDVSDICAAFVGDGWLVGWVDERHGDAEVYVSKVNRALVRIGNEQRITNASGAAADLSLLPLGASALAVWADARESQTPGSADIHAAVLSNRDASGGNEARLFATRAHSFAPAVQPLDKGALVGWLEAKSDETKAGVYIGVLDGQAKLQVEPVLVPIEDGTPTALTLACSAGACRALVIVDLGGSIELRGFTAKPGKAMQATRLTTLGGASAASVAPVVLGDVAYYADVTAERQGRLRRARIEWE